MRQVNHKLLIIFIPLDLVLIDLLFIESVNVGLLVFDVIL